MSASSQNTMTFDTHIYLQSKETYYIVRRDLLQCQKKPITVSKETYHSVKRDKPSEFIRPYRPTFYSYNQEHIRNTLGAHQQRIRNTYICNSFELHTYILLTKRGATRQETSKRILFLFYKPIQTYTHPYTPIHTYCRVHTQQGAHTVGSRDSHTISLSLHTHTHTLHKYV